LLEDANWIRDGISSLPTKSISSLERSSSGIVSREAVGILLDGSTAAAAAAAVAVAAAATVPPAASALIAAAAASSSSSRRDLLPVRDVCVGWDYHGDGAETKRWEGAV